MKRNILFGSVLAAALSVGVGAQTGRAARRGGRDCRAGRHGRSGHASTSSKQAGGKQSEGTSP